MLPRFIEDSLDGYMASGLDKWQIPGLAVGIVTRGQVVWLKDHWTKAINGTGNVDENTLFMIGSNTTAFTATLMAMMEVSETTEKTY